MLCRYCQNKESPNKSGLTRHEKHCKSNPEYIPNTGRRPWLPGDPRCKHSEKTKEKIRAKATGRAKTEEAEKIRISKIQEKARASNGGYRQGSGRGKKGWYKGIFCDSSWELAYLIYCIDNNIEIRRNTEKRKYTFNGKIMTYIPDFVVDGICVEIKGYKTEQWLAKLEANTDVKVLYEDDLKGIFDYVKDKYGAEYINLYGR